MHVGNCNIQTERKILFVNEMKWYKIWPRPKVWVQKIFGNFLNNFDDSFDESCPKFCPFCMAWTKVSKMQQIFNEIFKSILKFFLGLLWN